MTTSRLLDLYDKVSDAPDAIPRLRRFILDLAVRGKLVEQDPSDEPASELLKRIAAEKQRSQCGDGLDRTHQPVKDPYPIEVPASWALPTLDDICIRIHYGYTASATNASADTRLLRITDIQGGEVDWNRVPGCEIDESELRKYVLEEGDLLIARTGGTIGKTFLVSHVAVRSVFASYLIRAKLSRNLNSEYVKLFSGSMIYWEQLRKGSRGGAQPNVNGTTLKKMIVPLPPLAEQHRIVAKVDELMALLDQLEAARTTAEATRDRLTIASLARLTAPESPPDDFRSHARFALNALPALSTRADQIKSLRQTILNLAVRGKLVEQDPNDEPASELLKRIAAEKERLVEVGESRARKSLAAIEERPFEIPGSWCWERLGNIANYIQRGKSPEYAVGKGVPVISQKCVQWTGLNIDVAKNITFDSLANYEDVRFLRDDDLLWNSTGTGTIGRVIRLAQVSQRLVCDSHVTVVRCVGVNSEYIRTWLRTDDVFGSIEDRAAGSTNQVELTAQMANNQPVPLPPLAEQHRIVAKVDDLMALLDKLESALVNADSTKQRLLELLLHEALYTEANGGSAVAALA